MSHVDLSALRMSEPAPVMPRKPFGPRLLGLALALLVLGVAASFLWPLLHPVRAVPMARVRLAAAAPGQAAAGNAVAEAVGWVEADPFPTFVRPLVEGRIESLAVLEGTVVKAGETVVATLASAPLLAAHDRAGAAFVAAQAERDAAAAALQKAKARRTQNAEARRVQLEAQVALADAVAKLAAAEGERDRSAAASRGAKAALQAQQRLRDAGTTNEVALARAEAEVAASTATAEAAGRAATAAGAAHTAAAAAAHLADEIAAAPADLDGELAVATAEAARAEAKLAAAATDRDVAARELAWTTVKAPVDGVVLRLLAAPGSAAGPTGEPILSLYDRAHLRARIDVPLGSVGAVQPGQPVELRSEVTGDRVVRGVVQRLQHESDPLKNTLQVKIALQDPPELWRPETLCRARFLGAPAANPQASAAAVAFVVPKAAVQNGMVFVFDPTRGAARAIAVTVVQEDADGVVVRGELAAAMTVILAPVRDGEAVQEQPR